MPAAGSCRAVEMSEDVFLFFRRHIGGFARIKTDEDHVVVAARRERKHAQRADDALFHLIAKHGAAVIDERQNNRTAVAKIVVELDALAGLVDERHVQRDLPVERRFKTNIAQRRRHIRGSLSDTTRNGLRAEGAGSEKEQHSGRKQLARMSHALNSFSPYPALFQQAWGFPMILPARNRLRPWPRLSS